MSKVHRMGLQKIHKISKTRVVIQTYEVSRVFMVCFYTYPPQTMHACVCVGLALPLLVCWYDLATYLLGYP